jgi:septum formation protein
MRQIILASTSPRRKEILSKTGLKFKTIKSAYQENMNLKLKPKELAKFLSYGKARAVSQKYKNSLIVAADTFVAFKNEVMGKPRNSEEALKMLEKISGKSVSIITGFTILDASSSKKISRTVETKIYFKKFTKDEIKNYILTKEPLDKAGAFAIQGIGAIFIKRIEGDFLGAMGLPLFDLSESLKKFNINIL